MWAFVGRGAGFARDEELKQNDTGDSEDLG